MRPVALIAVASGLFAGQAVAQATTEASAAAYDQRLRESMASVRTFQGPMDGGWVLLSGARELFIFEFIDRNGVVEGSWRDPRRPDALAASGFVDQVERRVDGLMVRIGERQVLLKSDKDGRLSGELTEAGRTEAVTLRRRGP